MYFFVKFIHSKGTIFSNSTASDDNRQTAIIFDILRSCPHFKKSGFLPCPSDDFTEKIGCAFPLQCDAFYILNEIIVFLYGNKKSRPLV